MLDYSKILEIEPFSLSKNDKEVFLTKYLSDLTCYHYNNCQEYRKILDAIQFDLTNISSYYDIPFLPVRLFK